MPKSKNKRKSGQLGCGFVLSCGIVLIGMLIANALFVKAFFGANLSGLDDRVFNAAQFVLPIVMIAIEFWIYDQVVNWRKLAKEEKKRK